MGDGEVNVVLFAIEASAHGLGFLPRVATSDGCIYVVSPLPTRAVGREVEHFVALIVEWGYLVGRTVDVWTQVDTLSTGAIFNYAIPYIHAPLSSWAVGREVEYHTAVGQTADGGLCGRVVFHVDRPT